MADLPSIHSLDAISRALGAASRRFDITVLDECGSTNAELLARAGQSAPSGCVIVAQRQTAGRGRMGRAWYAAPGDSLAFSLLWRFPDRTKLGGLSLVVGLAVARALEKVGVAGTALKWPNDVLKDGRKLAGILIELESSGAAVIGIGLNRRLGQGMPAELRESAAALDVECDADELLALLLAELQRALDAFPAGGFAATRDDWLARHAWTGRAVRVDGGHGTPVTGDCVGVDDDGALLLATADGLQRILSGDVSLRLA